MSIDFPPATLPESTGSILLEPKTILDRDDWAGPHSFHLGFGAEIQSMTISDQKCRRYKENEGLVALEGHAKLTCLLFIYMVYKIHSKVA
jgi:hypothetical protein